MNNKDFNNLLDEQLEIIKDTLASKNKEYSIGEDRLSNFKEGAEVNSSNSLEILWGYYLKHFLSVKKIVKDYSKNGTLPTHELLQEKVTDSINYHILLKAIVTELIEEDEI